MSRRIEDVISGMLKGGARKNALDLADHLRAGEESGDFSIGKLNEGDENIWIVRTKGENVCCILLNSDNPESFTVWVCGDHIGEGAGVSVDEHIKEVAWANVFFPCCGAGCGCSRESRYKSIFGKQFDDVCTAQLTVAMQFENPGDETLDCMKRIVAIRTGDIINTI